MTAPTDSIGARVRTARDKLDLSQEDVARRAGISVGTLASLEQGRTKRPRDAVLQKLAEALETTVERLERGPVESIAPDPLAIRVRQTFGADAEAIERWLANAEDYTPADRRFVLGIIDWMQDVMSAGQRHRAGADSSSLLLEARSR